jgi:ligand-binding sensor domain-containing protein
MTPQIRAVPSSSCLLALISFLVINAPCANAQARNLNWRVYGAEDGLPSSNITAITQDKKGHLWVGTASAGLLRFDGAQFVHVDAGGYKVQALVTGRDGSIWVGFSRAGGVTRIGANNEVKTYTMASDGLAGVLALIEDRHGTIWAGDRGGLVRFRAGRWEHLSESHGAPNSSVFSIVEDGRGALWASAASGIYRQKGDSDQFERVSDTPARALAADTGGRVWAIDPRRGLRPVDAMFNRDVLSSVGGPVQGLRLLDDHRGEWWLGTAEHGLLRFGVSGSTAGTVVRALPADLVERGTTWAFFEDAEGTVWVGTSGRLYRFAESDMRIAHRFQALAKDAVSAIETSANGDLWIGTDTGLSVAHPSGNALQLSEVMRGTRITTLRADSSGHVWVGTSEGVGRVANGQISMLPGTLKDAVVDIAIDGRAGVWVCYGSDSEPHIWRDNQWHRFTGLTGTQSCSALSSDPQGNIWIGLGGGAVADQEGKQLPTPAGGSDTANVCAMEVDRAGTLWAATTNGLMRYDSGRVFALNDRNGLPARGVNGVIEDAAGNLWLALDSGIVRIAKAEIERAVVDPAYRVRYLLYDESDGLSDSVNCLSHAGVVKAPNGVLWFTTAGFVASISPDHVRQASVAFGLQIEDAQADQQTIDPNTRGASFPSTVRRLQITYGTTTLSAASKARFRFKLDGFDSAWIDAGRRRDVLYTGLPPGSYRFNVRGSIGGTDESEATWAFSVQPMFYQTRWFYALCVGALGVALGAVWQVRVVVLRGQYARVLEERARIARALHDTLIQSMAGAALKLEGIAMDLSGESASELRHLRGEIEHHIGEARRSIHDLRAATLETSTLEAALRKSAHALTENTGIAVDMSVVGNPQRYPHHIEEELLRIGGESISNAVRHAQARHLRIELAYRQTSLGLRVADDGCGFDPEEVAATRGRWGLKGLYERAARVGGFVRVTSQPGQGTEVITSIPLDGGSL